MNFIADLWEVPKSNRTNQIDILANILNLQEKMNCFIKTYSQGMRQKLALLAALIHNPKLLILDEPLTGLDPTSSKIVKDYLKIYASQGNTIIFSTHILEVAQRLCNEIVIISQGQVVTQESLQTLTHRFGGTRNLEDIYINITQNTKILSPDY